MSSAYAANNYYAQQSAGKPFKWKFSGERSSKEGLIFISIESLSQLSAPLGNQTGRGESFPSPWLTKIILGVAKISSFNTRYKIWLTNTSSFNYHSSHTFISCQGLQSSLSRSTSNCRSPCVGKKNLFSCFHKRTAFKGWSKYV